MIRIGLAALALANGAAADAAKSGCMQPADAEALMVTLAPDVLTAVAQRCAPALPDAAALAARWRNEGAGLEPAAARAIGVFMGEDLKGGDPVAMLSLVRTALVNELVKDMKPASCATVDRALTLAAPLPARNIAGLFVMFAQAGGAGKKGDDFPICKAAKP